MASEGADQQVVRNTKLTLQALKLKLDNLKYPFWKIDKLHDKQLGNTYGSNTLNLDVDWICSQVKQLNFFDFDVTNIMTHENRQSLVHSLVQTMSDGFALVDQGAHEFLPFKHINNNPFKLFDHVHQITRNNIFSEHELQVVERALKSKFINHSKELDMDMRNSIADIAYRENLDKVNPHKKPKVSL